jgi:hypothetical protein
MNSSNENLIYLRTNVKPILASLFEEIAKNHPDDIINFSINYLKKLNEVNKQDHH